MASNDTVKLVHPNGVTVSVAKGSADQLVRMGFTKPTAKTTSSSKSS